MSNKIFEIDRELQNYRDSLALLLSKTLTMAEKNSNYQLIETINSLKDSINKPFMFVVVGEVKSGKSSFINALIDADVCKTDLKPCTDKIQEIYYADEPFEKEINAERIEIGKPIEILKEICIVDTPGTNSIINNHQVLTEKFIPNSDLVFFVLLSKALFCQSTWDFLNFINKEWHTKFIFIIQQADLLSPEQLKQAISEVKEIAVTKGINNPYLFATSAFLELNNESDRSGFEELRNFIKKIVRTRQIYKIKLNNATLKTKIIIKELAREIKVSKESLELNKATMNLIKRRFENGRNKSQEELDNTVRYISESYTQMCETLKEKLSKELSLLSLIQKTFSFSLKKYLIKFTEECQENWQIEIKQIGRQRAKYIDDSIWQFSKGLTEELATVSSNNLKNKKISLKDSEKIKELLENIEDRLDDLIKNQDIFKCMINAGAGGAALAKGGFYSSLTLIIVKVIELTFQELVAMVFELILGGFGVIFFITGLSWQRNSIISKFNQSLNEKKLSLENKLKQQLNQKLQIIYDSLEEPFLEFYDDIAKKEKDVLFLEKSYSNIIIDFEKLDFEKLSLQK